MPPEVHQATRTPAAHSVLRAAEGGALVVAADFGTAGRPSATFTELVEGLRAPYEFWETMPPPHGEEAGMSAAQHIERWMRDIRESGRPVRAVIGFCSGSVYAAGLVDEIARLQKRPRLVLIDPDLAERHMVIGHYERFMTARLTPVLTGEEVEAAVRAGRDADAAAATPLELAAALGALCLRILPDACERGGAPEGRGRELAEIFASYLHWLAAGAELDARAVWREATAINSRTEGFGLDAFPEEERAGLVAEVIDFDIPHLELMRTPEVARTVDGLLQTEQPADRSLA
ncbi:hypothetical protein [Streptomyces parvus]|uniref:Thioesterase domain-containing protein n=1 Tax=Streptomyces parvus TaxID=66428 RepID=A0A7K3RZ32_9ACTN|nr:hypothetical protein [Streptomyces parvus]NEC19972.1 hypothetical protein [Streptomyces parvus]